MLLSNLLPAKRISCLNPECSHSITASLYARALQVHVQAICSQSLPPPMLESCMYRQYVVNHCLLLCWSPVHIQAICSQSLPPPMLGPCTYTGNMQSITASSYAGTLYIYRQYAVNHCLFLCWGPVHIQAIYSQSLPPPMLEPCTYTGNMQSITASSYAGALYMLYIYRQYVVNHCLLLCWSPVYAVHIQAIYNQ